MEACNKPLQNIFYLSERSGRMPRRKAEAELLSPEDQPTRGRKKLVEAEHTIKYSAPVPVTVEETSEETELDLFDDEAIEEKPKRRVNNERDELRKKLAKNHVTPGSELKLTIERYLHSDAVDGAGGMFAEKEHCAKYVCNESHITSEDYLDVARNKFGPGLYRFTLRMKNQIVTAWDKRISGGMAGTVIQHSNPNDPNSPQVIVQMPEGIGAQQPVTVVDPWKQMREAAKFYKELKQTFESDSTPSQQQPRSEEEVLTSAILNRPEVVDNLVGSVLKRVGGKGSGDSDPWADVAMEAVKSGQAANLVKSAIDALFNGFRGLFPGGQNNGQTQMAQAPLAQSPGSENPPQQNGQADQFRQSLPAQGQSQGSQSVVETGPAADPGPVTPDPYAQMLTGVITTLAGNGPVEEAIKRVDGFLLLYPAYTETIDARFSQPAETLLGAISTIPGCEQIAQADHAKQWVENFQAKFFAESQEGEEE
jgi:hypothetical protein